MKLVQNMKVSVKILILVVIGALGMAILGVMGISSVNKASADMNNMYDRKLQAVKLLGNEINYMRMIQVRIVKHILDPDDKDIENSIQSAIDSYEETWPEYARLGNMLPSVAAIIPGAESAWETYKSGIEETKKIVKTGDTDKAWKYYKDVEAGPTQELLHELQNLQQIANDNADILKKETDERSHSQLALTIILIVVCIGVLALLSTVIILDIMKTLNTFMAEIEKMKNGDFRFSEKQMIRKDEFGTMALSLRDMKASLGELMKQVSISSEQIAASSEELAASADQSAQASNQVAGSAQVVVDLIDGQIIAVKESNQSLDKVNAAVEQVKHESVKVAEGSKIAADKSAEGKNAVDTSVRTIKNVESLVTESSELVNQLGVRSQEIGEIVDAISSIADQTNLLALNATIEAARAGEHGKGFAVVAEEVSKLASESQLSTEKIASLIKGIQIDTQKAVNAMNSGKDAVIEGARTIEDLKDVFDQINDLVANVSGQMDNVSDSVGTLVSEATLIATGVQAINKHSDKISENMETVSAATEEQSATNQEIAAASESLASLAQDQQESIAKFQF
ncbi:methyl-accepting chemotaxis protein [Lachnospiraceae bacterium]|nr:methyl-accepting chemotaxis protein [Lachnospiraceae bacterium]